MKKIKIDKNIYSKNASWTFGKNIAPKFDSHIKKSIPMYKDTQWYVVKYLIFLLKKILLFMTLAVQLGLT